MHHFIYPSQDTYITNLPNKDTLNYGLDEILRVGTVSEVSQVITPTSTFVSTNQVVGNWCVTLFSGSVASGSLVGTSSLLIGSASLITGSASGSLNVTSSHGHFVNFSGSATGFFGSVSGFSGKIISGIVTGTNVVLVPHEFITSSIYIKRSLVQFDISTISQSIAVGDIVSPRFVLKVKLAKGESLPIDYSVYGMQIAESWTMGNGYESDGGSSQGASWIYRDADNGTRWSVPGGTFGSPICSQSFNYQAGDLEMDVTAIANAWLHGAPNNGIILFSSDESSPTGSGMQLSFFSNDSNTIYRPVLDVSWNDTTITTASFWTSSVGMTTIPAGLVGKITTGAQITGSSINGIFSGSSNISVDSNNSASGIITATGVSGSVKGLYIYGNIYGEYISSSLSATLIDGYFSGSKITSGSINWFNLSGFISGSWIDTQFVGNTISASVPFVNYPSIIFASLKGPYINGTVLGSVNTTDPTSSGVFTGILTDGPLSPANVYLPYSGTTLTSSITYTSSVVIGSSSLDPLQLNKPFVTVVQNLKPTVRAGNIIRVNVFGREEFPLKNFARSTQFSQFLTPKYLPVTSYYSIKDNETEEIVVDFDNYTQISCDLNGNYFLLDTTGLPQERYFKILIRTEQSGSIVTNDNGDVFKIVR